MLSYLATYAVFAGVCVMAYPGDIYIETLGINIQTTVCHCSMIIVGAYLFASGRVKLEHKTLLRALPVFCCVVAVAAVLNEVANAAGILQEHTFNMFFISPYCEPSLPVYSLVQGVVPFPLCLVLYVAGFTLAAWLILLMAMSIGKLTGKKQAVVQG